MNSIFALFLIYWTARIIERRLFFAKLESTRRLVGEVPYRRRLGMMQVSVRCWVAVHQLEAHRLIVPRRNHSTADCPSVVRHLGAHPLIVPCWNRSTADCP